MNDETSKRALEKETGTHGSSKHRKTKKRKGSKKGYPENPRNPRSARSKGFGELKKGTMYNDLSWYTRNKTIAEAFTKIPFNYIVGNKPVGMRQAGLDLFMPAIASYGVDFVVNMKDTGDSNETRDILNEVATIIYTNMRRHNAGATNDIEYVDVITSNLIAGIDIVANTVYGGRVFKIANSFTWKNRMIPRELFNHMGFDYDDFIANQANYRGRFNTLIAEARTIKVLHNYPFIDAYLAQFENVFKDSDTDTGREQIIIPTKPFHHIYDAVGSTQHPGGTVRIMNNGDLLTYDMTKSDYWKSPLVLAPVPENYSPDGGASWAVRLKTVPFSFFLDILNTQIQALIRDADFNLIQADIEKAFGEQGSYIVADTVTSDNTLEPVYSGEFNTVFHNGTYLPRPDAQFVVDLESNTIRETTLKYQNMYVNTVFQAHDGLTGEVRLGTHWQYFPRATENPSTQFQVLQGFCDSDEDDPSIENVIAMTRYKGVYTGLQKSSLSAEWAVPVAITATYGLSREVTSNFVVFGGYVSRVWFKNNEQTGFIDHVEWRNTKVLGQAVNQYQEIPLLGFKNRPLVFGYIFDGSVSGLPQVAQVLGDFNNVRCLSIDELFNLNEGCFLSLWSLPELTTI